MQAVPQGSADPTCSDDQGGGSGGGDGGGEGGGGHGDGGGGGLGSGLGGGGVERQILSFSKTEHTTLTTHSTEATQRHSW